MVQNQYLQTPATTDMSDTELFLDGTRHAFDYLGLWVYQSNAKRVLIQSYDRGVIKQCLLRLPLSLDAVYLPRTDLVNVGAWPWPIVSKDSFSKTLAIDLELYPCSLEISAPKPIASRVIGCIRNRYSYKKFLYPKYISAPINQVIRKLQLQGYTCNQMIGVYPPMFIFWWSCAILAEKYTSKHYFRLRDRAFRMISTSGIQRFLSYLVVFDAKR